jgi:mannose-6-phosphate isomerase
MSRTVESTASLHRVLTPGIVVLRQTFLNDILPLWIDRAYDKSTGHFYEGLEPDGRTPVSDRLRIRTAARMIHVCADAARLGYGPDVCLAAAVRAADALERDAKRSEGGYVREISRTSGKVLDPALDLYDQSCVILALSSLHHTTGDPLFRLRADAVLSAIDATLASPSGGWHEDEIGSLPRRQNPHMHMFEALSALFAATGASVYRTRLSSLFELLTRCFLLPNGLLAEFMGPRWERSPEYGSHLHDPGHMAEWAWLLRSDGPAHGLAPPGLADRLMSMALSIGRDPRDPRFLLDEVNAEGRHVGRGRRLWSQVEGVKGCLATGRIDDAEVMAQGILETYLGDATQLPLRDAFDAAGRPVEGPMPSSSCYHLWTMVAGTSGYLPKDV